MVHFQASYTLLAPTAPYSWHRGISCQGKSTGFGLRQTWLPHELVTNSESSSEALCLSEPIFPSAMGTVIPSLASVVGIEWVSKPKPPKTVPGLDVH